MRWSRTSPSLTFCIAVAVRLILQSSSWLLWLPATVDDDDEEEDGDAMVAADSVVVTVAMGALVVVATAVGDSDGTAVAGGCGPLAVDFMRAMSRSRLASMRTHRS